MQEKILTNKEVKELGLDKVLVITADMLDGYTKIEDWAFAYCTSLTSITIPNSVTSIGDAAFSYCINLESITIPNSVTTIGDSAFSNCTDLKSIVIPNSVTSIGDNAFEYCHSLESVTIPNSVTSIGDYAFFYCRKLTAVHISDIAAWCKIAFSDDDANPLSYAHNLYLNGTLVTDLVIPDGITSIEDNAFRGCRSLTSVTIPNSVTSIGWYAFSWCTCLKSITIPNSVTSIGGSAFSSCKSLASIIIPNSVTSIEKGAFFCCTNLKSITIGDKEYKSHEIVNGKCKAYKGFNANMTCRDFKYEDGKAYEFEGEPKLCECGFHACLNLSDVFNYYCGEFGKNVVVYEVELEGVTEEHTGVSKVVAKKITIGKRIL